MLTRLRVLLIRLIAGKDIAVVMNVSHRGITISRTCCSALLVQGNRYLDA